MNKQADTSTDLTQETALEHVDINHLTDEETKHFLTPFAFKLDKSLFGLPLASPSKRGIALLIDLCLIALLAEVSGVILALAIAITLYRLGNKNRAEIQGKQRGSKRRAVMRFIAALMVFIILLKTIPPLFTFFDSEEGNSGVNVANKSLTLEQSLTITAYSISAIATVADSDCKDLACWQIELLPVAFNIASISNEAQVDIPKDDLDEVFNEISQATKLSSDEQALLIKELNLAYLFKITEYQYKNESMVMLSKKLDQDDTHSIESDSQLINGNEIVEKDKSDKPVYSLIQWVKGIINDLGLGFGWATFYFTAFIALWNGQTIGKKLLGIKVLQLDGSQLSLWDSFGRYGGYGAGLATGLLGFIQVYWDPNRQAIHDKISATVVIDIRKKNLSD
jgi:uncharacterized RDD family membrane protein YckC